MQGKLVRAEYFTAHKLDFVKRRKIISVMEFQIVSFKIGPNQLYASL